MPTRLPSQRPFSTAEARALGLNRSTLASLLRDGAIVRQSRGWYARIDECRDEVAMALSRTGDAHWLVAAHATAAAVHGLRTPHLADSRTYFVCAPGRRRPDYRPDVVILPAAISRQDVVEMRGLRVTSRARTALDLARGEPLAYALVSVDHALLLGTRRSELIASRQRMRGWPGSRVLDAAIDLADARSESALESMSRGTIVASGLPIPDLQHWVLGRSGQRWRADLAWPDDKVIGECDGFGKWANRGEHEKANFRDQDLRAAGWTVVHWTFEQMMTGGRPALRWLADALSARASSPAPAPLHSPTARRARRVA